ncbi:hypothetical protein [Butyrivibrio sp. VCB2006]|uniref:hypothetical protein n=1 Tax=Butyrivibrio sp. VCB2006 TaxID=1280679 RepID=UPI0004132CD6|nr:hypothetical protein [Butyrivibrio sp. VCB2006]
MNDSVENMVQKIKQDAKKSEESFLQEVDSAVRSAIAENIDNANFQDSVKALKENAEELGQLKNIPDIIRTNNESWQNIKDIKASEEQTANEIQFIKNTLKPEDVTDFKAKMKGISDKNESILEKVQKLESTLTPKDIIDIKTNLDTLDSTIKGISASETDIIANIKTLKDVIKAEDIASILTKLNGISESNESASEIIKSIQTCVISENETSVKSILLKLEELESEKFSSIIVTLNDIKSNVAELEARQDASTRIEELQKKTEEICDTVNNIHDKNDERLDRISKITQWGLYLNMVSIIGIIVLLILRFLG